MVPCLEGQLRYSAQTTARMADLKWRKSRKNCHAASERQSFTGSM
jgi:hypothetical protein